MQCPRSFLFAYVTLCILEELFGTYSVFVAAVGPYTLGTVFPSSVKDPMDVNLGVIALTL